MVEQDGLTFVFEDPVGEPQVEISLAWSDDDDFEHEGYYDNIDEAIAALLKLKEEWCEPHNSLS